MGPHVVSATERQRLFAWLDELPLLVAVTDGDAAVRFANRHCRERLGAAAQKPWHLELGESPDWTAPDGRTYEVAVHPLTDDDGSPLTIVFGIAVTEHRLAREADRRARATAETLRDAMVALTRTLDRDTVLTTLLEHLRRLVPFDEASVMLLEEPARLSVCTVFDGHSVRAVAPSERRDLLAEDHPALRQILTTGAALLIPDTRAVPDWRPLDGSPAAVSWLGVPLSARGSVTGLFTVAKQEAGSFNEEHLRLAETLSAQASVAVENALLFEQMQAARVRMQDLSRRLVEVQEEERRTVARELHDEAGQALVSLRYGLQLVERETRGREVITAHVAELKRTTDAVIDNLHRLAADLRPPSLDLLGLDSALRQYLGSVEEKSGLTVRYKARGLTEDRLSTTLETALYRIVQEAVTNVLRHAGATRVDVLVERGEDRVLAVVEDDGVGFTPVGPESGHRLGLVGIRERAEALGGKLTIESAPGAGTTIAVEVSS